jgi:MFS transporter, FSR family, fosmidomycin resistance protein
MAKQKNTKITLLNILHVLNDGFLVSLPLLLPFISKGLGINLAEVGILGTFLNVLGIFLALPAGYIAHKIGGLKVLVIAVLLYSIGFFGTALSTSLYMLALFFFIAGIGFGVFHPISFALVSRWSIKENRGRLMGNFTAIGDIGRIGFSTVITFLIAYIGWQLTSLSFGLLALLIFLLLYWFFVKDRQVNSEELSKPILVTKSSIIDLLKNKKFVLCSTSSAIDSLASSALFIFLPFLLIERGVEPSLFGSFTAAFFIGNMAGKTVLGRLVDTFGNLKIFIVAELLMALFIFLLANTPSLVLIVLFSIILGAFTKGTAPVVQTMIAESVEDYGNFEKAFGVKETISGSATAIAPLLLGFVAYQFGIVNAFNLSAVFALLAIIPALLATKTKMV